jgi:hypothetical protein
MAAQDVGYEPEVICVEPYPTDFLVAEAAKGTITLKKQKAQLLDLAVIEALKADVLFFVDSTHTLDPAGEVSRIILEMLPRLKPGAFVHFHDICRRGLSAPQFKGEIANAAGPGQTFAFSAFGLRQRN